MAFYSNTIEYTIDAQTFDILYFPMLICNAGDGGGGGLMEHVRDRWTKSIL
jgi:hypothetical protein